MNYSSIIALFIAPVFALLLFFYFKPRLEKRCFNLLIKSFFFGFLSIILAVIVQITILAMEPRTPIEFYFPPQATKCGFSKIAFLA